MLYMVIMQQLEFLRLT